VITLKHVNIYANMLQNKWVSSNFGKNRDENYDK